MAKLNISLPDSVKEGFLRWCENNDKKPSAVIREIVLEKFYSPDQIIGVWRGFSFGNETDEYMFLNGLAQSAPMKPEEYKRLIELRKGFSKLVESKNEHER